MKGMQAISRGRSFAGLLRYVLSSERANGPPGRVVGGNMSHRQMSGLLAEFEALRSLRPDIAKPVWHNSLRLPKGQTLPDKVWMDLAAAYMHAMGFTSLHGWMAALHDDGDGQHIHIVACRVAADGSLYLGRNENLNSTQHIGALEIRFGLTETPQPQPNDKGSVTRASKRKLSANEINMVLSGGLLEAPREKLQRWIDEVFAANGRPAATEFVRLLRAKGASVQPNIASTGRMNGFSFVCDGIAFKGSSLGTHYGWAGLQKRGVSYVQDRDREELGRDQPSTRGTHQTSTGGRQAGREVPAPDVAAADIRNQALDRAPSDRARSETPYVARPDLGGHRVGAAVGGLVVRREHAVDTSTASPADDRSDNTVLARPSSAHPAKRGLSRVLPLHHGDEQASDKSDRRPSSSERRQDTAALSGVTRGKSAARRAFEGYSAVEIGSATQFWHLGRLAFWDHGDIVEVDDTSIVSVLAAMQLARMKFGSLLITGPSEFKAKCVALAAAHGFVIGNPELQTELRSAVLAREDRAPSFQDAADGEPRLGMGM